LVAGAPGCQFNEHEAGDGEIIRNRACGLGLEGIVSKQLDHP
jgi:ATP-dependent DNA ligase